MKNKRKKDQLNKKSLADQDSPVFLSDGALSTAEEMKEERIHGNDQEEHGGLDVAALGNSISEGRRPKGQAAPRTITQVAKEIEQNKDVGLDVAAFENSINERGHPKGKAAPRAVGLDVAALEDSIKQTRTGRPRGKAASTIYQVPRLLRQVDQNWYEPQLISIGPYHHDKECLKPMEEQKLQHLRKILSRNKKVKLKDYIEAIDKLEQRARKCYSQSICEITRDEFVEMMLLDGCFLVEIFLRNDVSDDVVPAIYQEMWLQDFISHDMLLVENQLPCFILRCIFELVVGDQKKVVPMAKLALDCFKYIPVMPLNHAAPMKRPYHHLVDLFHHHCLPNTSNDGGEMDSSIKEKLLRLVDSVLGRLLDSVTSFFSPKPEMHFDEQLPFHAPQATVIDCRKKIAGPVKAVVDCGKKIAGPVKAVIDRATSFFRGSHLPSEELDQRKPPLSIPSAEELEEAGISFKRKEKRGSFLSIKFDKNNGVMEIPYFYFSDGLDSVFQNFVAFEQCRYPKVKPFFVGYVLFMDYIINTGKDVKILRRSEVLEHGMGSDEELARVFNQMSRGVYFDARDTPLAELYKDIKCYCGKRRNVWQAYCKHNICNTPCAIISFIAAVSLLILTATQTLFSILPRN